MKGIGRQLRDMNLGKARFQRDTRNAPPNFEFRRSRLLFANYTVIHGMILRMIAEMCNLSFRRGGLDGLLCWDICVLLASVSFLPFPLSLS